MEISQSGYICQPNDTAACVYSTKCCNAQIIVMSAVTMHTEEWELQLLLKLVQRNRPQQEKVMEGESFTFGD